MFYFFLFSVLPHCAEAVCYNECGFLCNGKTGGP